MYNDYDDKELKSKFFKRQLADLSNETDEKLFEQIFDHKTYKISRWTNKYKKNKEKNQIIVNDIHKNKDKLFKKDEFGNWVIQAQQRSDLKYTIDLILNFNETIQLDLTWMHSIQNKKN